MIQFKKGDLVRRRPDYIDQFWRGSFKEASDPLSVYVVAEFLEDLNSISFRGSSKVFIADRFVPATFEGNLEELL